VPIDSDSTLLEAFRVYWESRRLPVTLEVIGTGPRLIQSEVSNANTSSDP
jgi:hypothetical protein